MKFERLQFHFGVRLSGCSRECFKMYTVHFLACFLKWNPETGLRLRESRVDHSHQSLMKIYFVLSVGWGGGMWSGAWVPPASLGIPS